VNHLFSWRALRRYSPYRSSGEYLGGMGVEVWEPHLGQVSLRVYSRHLSHILRVVFIVLVACGPV